MIGVRRFQLGCGHFGRSGDHAGFSGVHDTHLVAAHRDNAAGIVRGGLGMDATTALVGS
jgi:hypothetical protein